MKSVLITGITGQDGAYLAKFLLSKNYDVYGTYRRLSTPNFWRLGHLEILDKVKLIPADVYDTTSLLEALITSDATEVYNLAAQSFVGSSFDQPIYSSEIDGITPIKILEVIRQTNNDIRFYQASTSEMFGDNAPCPQDEDTVFLPSSPYAAAKLFAYHITRIYREAYGIFASNGILFNHESPIRGLEFVTRKISNSVARIKLGLQKYLCLGDLNAKRDWGYAPEYVEAMWKILQHNEPDDFVVASGETHSVIEFAEAAFNVVGLKSEGYVRTDDIYKRPNEVYLLQGNPSKIKKKISWQPKTKFTELVKLMVEADIHRWERYLKGELFHWDAFNYPYDIQVVKRKIRKDPKLFG